MYFQDVEERIKRSVLKYHGVNVSLPFRTNTLGTNTVTWFFFESNNADALTFTITKCFVYDDHDVRVWDVNLSVQIKNYNDTRQLIEHRSYMDIFVKQFVSEEDYVHPVTLLRTAEPLQMMNLYYAVIQHLSTIRDNLIDYKMTSVEYNEAQYVVEVVNGQEPTILLCIDMPAEKIFAIKCVKRGNRFDYYLLQHESGGFIHVLNISRGDSRTIDDSRDRAVFALLSSYCFGLGPRSREYHLHENYVVRESFDTKSGKYGLHLLTEHGSEQSKAEAITEYGQPVFNKTQCLCHRILFIKRAYDPVKCKWCGRLVAVTGNS